MEYDKTGRLVNPITKECAECGDEFSTYQPETKYCSNKCRNVASYKRNKKAPKEPLTRECPVCKQEFLAAHGGKKYCSDKCANKARSAEAKKSEKVCVICGNKIENGGNKYCSKRCEQQRYTKVCAMCNTEYKTPSNKQKFCSMSCSQMDQKQKQTGFFKTENQHGCYDKRERRFKNLFESKYPGFKYHGGYEGSEGYFESECRECGHIQKRNTQYIRPSRDKAMVCENCEVVKRNDKRLRERLVQALNKRCKQLNAEKRKVEVEQQRLQRIQATKERNLSTIKQCKECGTDYTSVVATMKYCSTRCANRRNDRVKEVRRRKKLYENGKVDYSITLPKLAKKDKGVCWICGKKTNNKDYIRTSEGYFIAGGSYPSIDHVLPVAKGGTHTWDNVRLAHVSCNVMKSDKDIVEMQGGQMVICV